MSRLRRLDIDDLRILRGLSAGMVLVQIAKLNFVTQPAITQRLRKMEFVFGGKALVVKGGRSLSLTEHGKAAAAIACEALAILEAFMVEVKRV